MVSFADTIIKHCAGIVPSLVDMHLRRMPESYLDRYSPAEIARHLRLIVKLTPERRVDVDVKPVGGNILEICIVGFDRTGVLAAITTALASDGLDVQDLQLSTYLPAEEQSEPTLFVDIARVGHTQRGLAATSVGKTLRERLEAAFKRLEEGDLAGAQTAASDSHWTDPKTPNSARVSPGDLIVKEGLILDGFRLEEKIATGGMSEVYLALQLSLQRKAAVKIVSNEADTADDTINRFAREAQVLAAFNCSYIVQVYASGTMPLPNGSPLRWMAMEYLPNGDLARWLGRYGPPRMDLGVRWFFQALQGLQYAHQNSILHRDLKPHNFLLTAEGDIKISDFGLLKKTKEKEGSMTLHGTVMGTPHYISPEQALAEQADERSDIYSLGATFFQLFSGRLAFEEKNTTAVLASITRDQAPSLFEIAPAVPRPIGVMINRMMARRPEDRYQNVNVILEDFRSYRQRGLLRPAEEGFLPEEPTFLKAPADMTQALRPASVRKTGVADLH